MSEKYTTKTASLKATRADVQKLDAKSIDAKNIKLNGTNIEDLIQNSSVNIEDGREVKTQYDIWEHAAVENEDGSVTVKNLYIPDASGWNDENVQENDCVSVIDNKVYIVRATHASFSNDFSKDNLPTEEYFYCNCDTSKIIDGTSLFSTSDSVMGGVGGDE